MSLKPEINYLLLWHLNRYKWIGVPGIGRFEGHEEKAYLDHQKGVIYPSKLKVSFTSGDQLDGEQMLENLQRESDYSMEALEESLGKLSFHLVTELKKSQQVVFEPYGILKQNESGEISFIPSQINLHDRFFGMEGKKLTPLVHQFQALPEVSVPVKPLPQKESNNFKWLYYLLGILWIIFLFLLMCPQRKSIHQSPAKVIVDDPIKKSLETQRESIELKQKYQDSIAGIHAVVNDSTNLNSTIQPEEKSSQGIKEEFNHETQILDHNIEELDGKIKGKQCVIIVGSFKVKANAEKLSRRVKNKNYNVYRESFGEFNRVGVKFDCLSKDLHTTLAELKKSFSPDSWILKY
ncbi:MAG: SPOR domain-containing protein [Saprospiraceae bacterium]|nr:SPOR domain-containing protein [Candidatus Vicinibacter affinis]